MSGKYFIVLVLRSKVICGVYFVWCSVRVYRSPKQKAFYVSSESASSHLDL